MSREKTFAAVEKLKEVEIELHRLKNALEMMNNAYDAAPPQRKPLPGEVIGLLATDPRFAHIETPTLAEFTRVIERAHKIGEKE